MAPRYRPMTSRSSTFSWHLSLNHRQQLSVFFPQKNCV
ncbi:hypothetical protein AB205_0213130 [Aquarana catesbeiana]|uniref:Uncharacterized protein n=1 Tax=Aquarana catesbeiana TaxID=8400 RepID=A0A2G9SI60_AQUCT|nr:hypothetical protein AB205_0213130 [Aquarana catesbeiana]